MSGEILNERDLVNHKLRGGNAAPLEGFVGVCHSNRAGTL